MRNQKIVKWIDEALPEVLGNRGKGHLFQGNGNKDQMLRGIGDIRKQIFDFGGTGEPANLFQGNKAEQVPSGSASLIILTGVSH